MGSNLPRWLVPLDAMLPGCIENSIQHAPTHLQGDKPENARLNGANHRLVQNTLDVSPKIFPFNHRAIFVLRNPY